MGLSEKDSELRARAALVQADPRWQAIATRDAGSDRAFVYGVVTTGIYCRPSCPARLAKPENVRFFVDAAAAQATGLRACRRCRPDASSPAADRARHIARACRSIEAASEPPTLARLATDAGMSPFHFHRVFKEVTGLTPKAYADGHRASRLRSALSDGGTNVTEAIYAAGYNSGSRFYEKAREVLGMKAEAFRRGGAGQTIRYAVTPCALGCLLVAASSQGICAVTLDDEAEALVRDLRARFPQATLASADAAMADAVAAVVKVVDGAASGADLPLDLRGTAFQQRVWQELRGIPAGQTVSYAELARRIGQPRSVRAVASACGANPIAVIVPCHRVLRSDGALSGYRWGTMRKRVLLDREKRE